jgi:hypothetical protein
MYTQYHNYQYLGLYNVIHMVYNNILYYSDMIHCFFYDIGLPVYICYSILRLNPSCQDLGYNTATHINVVSQVYPVSCIVTLVGVYGYGLDIPTTNSHIEGSPKW